METNQDGERKSLEMEAIDILGSQIDSIYKNSNTKILSEPDWIKVKTLRKWIAQLENQKERNAKTI